MPVKLDDTFCDKAVLLTGGLQAACDWVPSLRRGDGPLRPLKILDPSLLGPRSKDLQLEAGEWEGVLKDVWGAEGDRLLGRVPEAPVRLPRGECGPYPEEAWP